jgi:hypothetical protein
MRYLTDLLLTPGRVRDRDAVARLREQQELLLEQARRLRQDEADLSFQKTQRDAPILSRQGQAAFERDQVGRDNETVRTMTLDRHRTGLANQTLGAATDSKVQVIGATYGGAKDLITADGSVQERLQNARLQNARETLGLTQGFETAQTDRFIGPEAALPQILGTTERMQQRGIDSRLQMVEALRPGPVQRAIQALAPVALIAASLKG